MYKPKRVGGKLQSAVCTVVVLPSCSRHIHIYIYYNVQRAWFKGLVVDESNDVSVERCLRHPLSSGLLLALNRHFKEPAEVRCSRWTSVFVRVIFYSDGEQVKTGVYDTFVFHGTVEQPFCPPRLLAASTLSSRPPQHHHCHKGRDKQNRRAPPL